MEARNVQLTFEERRAKLVAKADVRRAWGLQATKVKNAFLGMGRALAPLLAHKGPIECQSVIDKRVLEILKDLSNSDYGPQTT